MAVKHSAFLQCCLICLLCIIKITVSPHFSLNKVKMTPKCMWKVYRLTFLHKRMKYVPFKVTLEKAAITLQPKSEMIQYLPYKSLLFETCISRCSSKMVCNLSAEQVVEHGMDCLDRPGMSSLNNKWLTGFR